MANLVEFIIKARDLVSGPMMRIGSAGDSAFSRLTRGSNNFQRSFTRLGSSIDQIESKLKDLERTRNMSIDGRQIRQINREMRELEERRGRLTGEGSRSSGGLGLGHIAGLFGIGSALALGGTVLKAGMDRQMAGTAFQVMAGKEQGAALHQNLIKFATDSIYGNEVFGEAKMMLGFGVGVKQILPSLNMLGDIAMGDVEHMKSLTLGFSEAAAAGKLTGREMLILTDAGFNPLQAMSEKTGRSIGDLTKDMSKGKISFSDLTAAFQYATGPMGKWHDGMKLMANTPTGKWIAFTGALETLGGTIGMNLLPGLGAVATLLNGVISNETVFYSIAAGIGAMTTAWGLYTVATKSAAIWTGIVAVLSSAAFFPIVMIGIIASALVVIAKKWDGWGTSAKAAWEITKDFFSDMKIGIVDFAQSIAYVFQVTFYRIKDFFQQIAHTWSKIKSGDFSDSPFTSEAGKKLISLTQQHAVDKMNNQKGWATNTLDEKKQWGKVGLKLSSSGIDPTGVGSGAAGKAGAGSMPSTMADTNKGISGGGVRNLTINVGNLGTGKIDIHAATVTEGAAEIRRIFEEMFLQVVNSGNAAIA